jgi:hypothetical protein
LILQLFFLLGERVNRAVRGLVLFGERIEGRRCLDQACRRFGEFAGEAVNFFGERVY